MFFTASAFMGLSDFFYWNEYSSISNFIYPCPTVQSSMYALVLQYLWSRVTILLFKIQLLCIFVGLIGCHSTLALSSHSITSVLQDKDNITRLMGQGVVDLSKEEGVQKDKLLRTGGQTNQRT